jgi:hypothetical protein
MKKIQEIIKINRNSITHKIKVDNTQIRESILLLRDLLKPKYAKSFYYCDLDFTGFIELDKNSNVINVRADHSHFFGSDYVTIFGVTLKVNDGVVEVKKENMVKDIPVYFGSSADNKLMQLRNELDNINDNIEIELRKILNNDESYAEALNKERLALTTNMKFKEDFDQALEQSDIVKKCSQKLNDFYNHKPLAITSGEKIKVRYDKIETNIYMKVEPYVYDRCLTLEFTRDTIYLGNLEITYDGKVKFEPYFKNQKYFTKEISSLKFMRNTFKKHLTECLG